MFNRRIAFNILYFFFVAIVNGDDTYQKYPIAESNHFDILIFTQRWPQTVCYVWKESSVSHTCSLPKDTNEWTIHGIWPSQYHKLGPQFCNKSLPFNSTALKPLQGQLQERWIDIEYGRESYGLWEHEWNKHGTCAAVLESLNTEVKYFGKGLNFLTIYDMKNVLAKANIVPGQTYEMMDIFNAIEKILGKRGTLICRKNKNTGELYIFEIRICFNKMLELVDCDGVYQYPTNCGTSNRVTYPGQVPHRYHVVQI